MLIDAARTAWRVKNQPLSGSVKKPASVIQPPISAMKDDNLATIPVVSGQLNVRTYWRSSVVVCAAGMVILCIVLGKLDRVIRGEGDV